jgi:hypothetical protein
MTIYYPTNMVQVLMAVSGIGDEVPVQGLPLPGLPVRTVRQLRELHEWPIDLRLVVEYRPVTKVRVELVVYR